MAGVWTDAAVDALRRHWLDGKSCAEIARLIKVETGVAVSRNAVIGKRSRIGLPDRWQKPSVDKQDTLFGPVGPRAKRDSRNRHAIKPLKPEAHKAPPRRPLLPDLHTPQPDSVKWRERPVWGCQWIFGEPGADALCCGRPAQPGSAWCAQHGALIRNVNTWRAA